MVLDLKKASISVGYHSGRLRDLAHGIKENDKESINEASRMMAKYVQKDYCLIPIPNHSGFAENTYELAKGISSIVGCDVVDALQGFSRESLYDVKKEGRTTNGLLFYFLVDKIPTDKRIILIDNVVATGATATEARKAVGRNCVLLTLTNAKY